MSNSETQGMFSKNTTGLEIQRAGDVHTHYYNRLTKLAEVTIIVINNFLNPCIIVKI